MLKGWKPQTLKIVGLLKRPYPYISERTVCAQHMNAVLTRSHFITKGNVNVIIVIT